MTTTREEQSADEPVITVIQCGCGSHSKCDHDWSGWRPFEDGNGGEQVCKKCGLGAVAHSLIAKAKRQRAQHLKTKVPTRNPLPGSKRSGWKQKLTGEWVRRDAE